MLNRISFLLILLILLIIGCGEPPKGTKEVRLIEFIKENLDLLNQIKDDEKKFLQYFKDVQNNTKIVFSFEKDTFIYIISDKAEPSKDDFLYSLPENSFMVNKPVYVTFFKKETLFSFDKNVWYSSLNDANKEIEGIRNNYFVTTKIENNSLYINYKMAFSLGRNPKIVNFTENREVVTLKKGMVFSSTDPKKINTNLENKILFVPENTLLSGEVKVIGNIINSQSKENQICLKAMQDLYFFVTPRMVSFSFDKKNWNLNLLSFAVEPNIDVYAKENNHVFFNVLATANYNAEQTSFSLLKLLVDMAF